MTQRSLDYSVVITNGTGVMRDSKSAYGYSAAVADGSWNVWNVRISMDSLKKPQKSAEKKDARPKWREKQAPLLALKSCLMKMAEMYTRRLRRKQKKARIANGRPKTPTPSKSSHGGILSSFMQRTVLWIVCLFCCP